MSTPQQKNSIRDYYNTTLSDYVRFWETRVHYGIHFGFYDTGILQHADAVLNMNRALADRVGPKIQGRVFDAGCGIGGSAVWLAEHGSERVTGVTISDKQYAIARRLTRARKIEHKARFVRGDMTRTYFPPESFDVFWALESTSHVADSEALFAEAYRLLSPGGRIAIVDFFLTDALRTRSEESRVQELRHGWILQGLMEKSRVLALLKGVGFEAVSYEDIFKQIRPSSRRLYRWGLSTYIPAMMRARLHSTEKNHLSRGIRLGAIRQYELLSERTCEYAIITATKAKR